jgi:hypothetical protein
MRPARVRSSCTRPTPKPIAARGWPSSRYCSSGIPAADASAASRPPVVITATGARRWRAAAKPDSVSTVSPEWLDAITSVRSVTPAGSP